MEKSMYILIHTILKRSLAEGSKILTYGNSTKQAGCIRCFKILQLLKGFHATANRYNIRTKVCEDKINGQQHGVTSKVQKGEKLSKMVHYQTDSEIIGPKSKSKEVRPEHVSGARTRNHF